MPNCQHFCGNYREERNTSSTRKSDHRKDNFENLKYFGK